MNTKDKLIQSALKLFNEKWFEATSTTSICTHAWFSSWALFVHFKTKNELLDYIYVSVKKDYFHSTFDTINTNKNLENILVELLEKSFEYYLNDYDKFMFVDRFANSHHISRIAHQEIKSEMNAFIDILNRWKKEGLFIDAPNDILLTIISSTFHGLVKYVHEHNIKKIDNIIPLVLKWIKK